MPNNVYNKDQYVTTNAIYSIIIEITFSSHICYKPSVLAEKYKNSVPNIK